MKMTRMGPHHPGHPVRNGLLASSFFDLSCQAPVHSGSCRNNKAQPERPETPDLLPNWGGWGCGHVRQTIMWR